MLRKRPYLSVDMCGAVVAKPVRQEVQPDGHMRFWGEVTLPGEQGTRILRVVTLEDGVTIHNAFLDRGFRKDEP